MSDFTIEDYEEMEREIAAETAADEYARVFIADVIDTAGTRLTLQPGDYEGVIRECARALYDAGFDPSPEKVDDDPIAWAFAGAAVHHDLKQELGKERLLTDTAPVVVAGHLPVYVDGAMPDRTVIMIHRDAVIPAPPGRVKKPWIIGHPDGVVVAEVGDE